MKFTEIAKPLVTRLLSEGMLVEGKEGKNTHLQHLEDNIFNKGFAGAKEAVNYLYSLHDMLKGNAKAPVSMTTKWDGAPALVCGKDPETGKFFVGTKGVFARQPKMNFTTNDIKLNHPGQDELQSKLALALKTLSQLNWDTVAQGDMLWGGGSKGLEPATIQGEDYITFTPNTITYAVPKDSKLANKMLSAKLGIVWHTEYIGGPTLADVQAKFGFDATRLGNTGAVWHDDATIKDVSGLVTLTAQESAGIQGAIQDADNYLKSIDPATFKWLEQGTDLIGKEFLQQLKAHVNMSLKTVGNFEQDPTKFAQGFVQKYIDFMQKKIDGYKTQKSVDKATEQLVNGVRFIKEHVPSIVAVYDLYLKIIEAKNVFVKKLGAIQSIPAFIKTGDGYEVTGEEGFVAIDRVGNALKLVDRLEFSVANFGTGKPGAK